VPSQWQDTERKAYSVTVDSTDVTSITRREGRLPYEPIPSSHRRLRDLREDETELKPRVQVLTYIVSSLDEGEFVAPDGRRGSQPRL
jgi:hypothetical protein